MTDNNSQLIKDLTNARNLLSTKGVIRGQFFGPNGCHCSVGALAKVINGDGLDFRGIRMDDAVEALTETLGEFSGDIEADRETIFKYNDFGAKDDAEVIGLFDRTIGRLAS